MYKTIEYTLKGISPTIIHSGRMANPLDPMTRLMKEVTSKRKKTDDDIALMSDIEWLASFYPSAEGEVEIKNNKLSFIGYGIPNWPGENVESMLIAAAKQQRLGKQFKAGVMCDGVFPIEFGEKKTIEQLFRDPKYRDVRRVRVQTATVMRTRPIFHNWSMKIRVSYLESVVNESAVTQAVEAAGSLIGLSDYRPKFGRFTVQ